MKSGSKIRAPDFGTRTLVGRSGLYIVVSSGSRTAVVDSAAAPAPVAAAADVTAAAPVNPVSPVAFGSRNESCRRSS